MLSDNKIFLAAQKDLRVEKPKKKIYMMLVLLATVKQMLKLPNGTLRVLVEGITPCYLG